MFSPLTLGTSSAEESTGLKDFVRGMEVDFEPPELLTLSGSYFTLDVELTKIRPRPLFFSLGVFLKTKDEYGRDLVTRIGCCPYVHIPLNQLQDKVVVSVPCFTTTSIVEQLSELNGAEDIEICDAEIGVKVEKIWQWGFSDLLWKYFINSALANNKIIMLPKPITCEIM